MLVTGDRYIFVSARKVRSHCRCRRALYCPMYSAWDTQMPTSVAPSSLMGHTPRLAMCSNLQAHQSPGGICVSDQLTTAVCNAMALRGFDIAKQSLQGDLVD
jgi:hypothetical protein